MSDRVTAKKMAPRTAKDYGIDAEVIFTGLGHIPIRALEPKHIVKFADERAKTNPAHVRNELACLSAALTWAVSVGLASANVCQRCSGRAKRSGSA